MIRLSFKLPNEFAVAVSGGPDSMAALDFLRRNKKVRVLHFINRMIYKIKFRPRELL